MERTFRNRRFLQILGSCFGTSVDPDVVKSWLKNLRFVVILASCFEASLDPDVVKKNDQRIYDLLQF